MKVSRTFIFIDIMSTENGGTNGRRRAGQRTMKLSATVVFLFFICWAPYNIMYLWCAQLESLHAHILTS